MKDRKPQKERKSHGVQLLIRAVVKDPEGKVLSDTGQKPSKSFVKQILVYLGAVFRGVDTYGKNILGLTTTYMYYGGRACDSPVLGVNAPINHSLYGIVIGTGDAAVDNEDYKLETQLTEGVGAGNITHGAMNVGTAAVVGANVDMEHKRAFTNNTGSAIIVKEAGIYAACDAPGVATRMFCIIRDVLDAPGITVPDRCSLTVYYTLRTTV